MGRTCGFGRLVLASLWLSVGLTAGIAGAAPSVTCASPNCPITITDNTSVSQDQAATPYPSNICCVADSGAIDTITVTLTGLTHQSLDNVDILLVSEAGPAAVELMSDVGGPLPASGLTLTFDDDASASLPRGLPATSGTYKPTNYPGTPSPCVSDNPPASATADPFPTPAPPPPASGYSQALSTFHGFADAGFHLYVGDDCSGGSGSISSWSYNVTYIPCSFLCLVKRADAVTVSAGSPMGFTLDASAGFCEFPPDCTIHGVTLDDPLPSGTGVTWSISPVYSGPGSCLITGAVGNQRLSCSFGDFTFFQGATVHISSATTIQSCGTYSNTGTLSASDASSVQDTTAITVTGCPTAVEISSTAATRTKRGVLVHWRTASEAGTLGFNVYRERAGRLLRMNPNLIPSVFGGSTTGHAYSWLDRTAPRAGTLKYRLGAVGLDGTRRWLGTTVVSG